MIWGRSVIGNLCIHGWGQGIGVKTPTPSHSASFSKMGGLPLSFIYTHYIPVETRGPESAAEISFHSLGIRSVRELESRAHLI